MLNILRRSVTSQKITFSKLFLAIRQHIILIMCWILACGVIGFVVARYAVTPEYTAQTELLVNQKHPKSNDSQQVSQQADVQMINTYKDFIVSRSVLVRASKDLANSGVPKRNYKISNLQKNINVTSKENSQIFTLTVRTNNPKYSEVIANTIADSFKEQVKRVMQLNNITVVSRAVEPQKPSFPNVKLFTIAGLILGLIIGLVHVILLVK